MIAMLRSHKIKEKKHSFEENMWERPVEGKRKNRKRLYVVQSYETYVKIYTAILSFVQCSEMKLRLISAFRSTARAQHHHLIHQWSSQQLYFLTDWNAKEQLKLSPPSVKSFWHLKWAIQMVSTWIALNKLQSLLPKDRRLLGHLGSRITSLRYTASVRDLHICILQMKPCCYLRSISDAPWLQQMLSPGTEAVYNSPCRLKKAQTGSH